MNTTEMQFKADTGLYSTIDIEIEEKTPDSMFKADYYKIEDMKALEIFSIKYENLIRLHIPEYIKWLEEKVIELQKQIK